MKRLLSMPYWRQRMRNRLVKRTRPFHYALVVWSAWAIASIILRVLFAELGLFYAMLLFGAIAFFSLAYVAQWLRVSVQRDRHWDEETKRENEHLVTDLVSPRRPLPPFESHMASAELQQCLWQLIHEERPNHVLELGSGLSTVVMAYALEACGKGKLTSLDDHAGYAARTRGHLRDHDLDAYANVILTRFGPPDVECGVPFWYALPDLHAEPPIDILFVDGPMSHFHPRIRYPALPVLHEFLADNATVVVDDCHKVAESYLVPEWLANYPALRVDGAFRHPRFTVLRFSRSPALASDDQRETKSAPIPSAAW